MARNQSRNADSIDVFSKSTRREVSARRIRAVKHSDAAAERRETRMATRLQTRAHIECDGQLEFELF